MVVNWPSKQFEEGSSWLHVRNMRVKCETVAKPGRDFRTACLPRSETDTWFALQRRQKQNFDSLCLSHMAHLTNKVDNDIRATSVHFVIIRFSLYTL